MRLARIHAEPTRGTSAIFGGVKLDLWLPFAVGVLSLGAAIGWIERGALTTRAPALGRVEGLVGQATSAGASATPTPLAVGAAVGAGERIEVAAGGRLRVDFPDGGKVVARSGASFELLHLRPLELQIRGGVVVVAGHAVIYTREGDAALRGGLASVEARDEGTEVRLAIGSAQVRGVGKSFDLAAAQRIAFHRAGADAGRPSPVPEPDPAAAAELAGEMK